AALCVTCWSLSTPCQAQPKYNITDLGSLGPWWSTADRINSRGQVAGSSPTSSGYAHAFRTRPNAAINPSTDDLGTLGGWSGQSTGINASGQVVGISTSFDGSLHSFRTAANAAINPSTDDLGIGWATGINSSGQVVGYDFAGHAFRTAPNRVINLATDDLGSLAGGSTVALGINDARHAVGISY